MTIDQEMELWEKRSKDNFGTLVAGLKIVTQDYFEAEENEYGFKTTPISELSSLYAVVGDRKNIYQRAYSICENWDLLEDENVARILKTMENLSKENKLDY